MVTSRVAARRVGAAIAMTGLNMALQTHPGNPYDTGQPRPRTGWPVPMDHPESPKPGLESTLDLVQLAKAGDQTALERLIARCLPPLRRWASGRLPRWTRDLMDTDDLVQETVFRAVNRIGAFEPRHEGALQAYLRQAVMNRIRDEVRRKMRTPAQESLDDQYEQKQSSPLEEAIGHEAVERYEAALARLRPEDREAIIARVEMESSYEAVAQALGKPSPDAARMAVSRALVRLAEEMNRGV
jgi:RNA polymerase sigma factor (sigma-70 family)